MGIRVPHLGTKIAAVVLALLIWLLVSDERTVERMLRVPLEFTSFPQALELVGEAPSLVDVRVRGSAGTISRIAEGDLAALLDLASARPGQRLFHITEADVRAPFGVEVIQITPASVELLFEAQTSRTVAVAARVEGTPAPGFAVTGVVVEPASVAVVGPAGMLEDVREATTEVVSVEGATETVTDTVNVGVAHPTVRVRQARPVTVTVTIARAPDG
jgi:YbbR domain-containing protein